MRKSLTDKGIATLKPRAVRYTFADPELRGHYVRVMPSGAKSFATVVRDPNRKQVWTTLGSTDGMSIDAARDLARPSLQRVRAGLPAVEPKADTFGAVAANWLKRHVEKNALRSRDDIVRLLDRYILPVWGNREFVSIRRSDITALLDKIEDDHGPRQADVILATVRSIMNWHASRHDNYSVPTVRGMRRQSPAARARGRVLDDDEIRAVWNAAETGGAFGGVVRLALLTAQRRAKLLTMRWADLKDGEWTIPKAPREKHAGGVLKLPKAAQAIIEAQPQIGDNPFVFAGRGDGPINGMSKAKRRFDATLPKKMPGWTIHDLRRTARSLMSRAGVSSEHAERVLGHAIPGVEGVYDRHAYRDEKGDALRKLAALLDAIAHPRPNVVPITKRAKRR